MTRPSEAEISQALEVLRAGGDDTPVERKALRTIRAALAPREVWPSKEVAACLRVSVSNLWHTSGLPEPFQVLDRPTSTLPDKKMRLWWRDEIEAHPWAYRDVSTREGG